MDITNKVVVISGGCSGLGLATAKYCIANNAKVALIDIDADKLHEVSNEIGALAVVADVAKSSAVESALQVISNAYGDIQVVVNCAGIAPAKRMVGRNGPMPLDVFANVININLLGTFNVMRVFSHRMSTQNVIENSNGSDCERGVIINTASVAAYDGQIGQAAYSASKGGIVAMTLPLARELAQFGIRVMTIAPGIMATPMVENYAR